MSIKIIEEAIIKTINQVPTSKQRGLIELSTAPNFQLLEPAIEWNWEVTAIGITPREQYEFSDHIPQSCEPSAQFFSSSNSFSDNYRTFLDVLAHNFQPSTILSDAKSKIQEPATPPADTSNVPDGWTKVYDGAGILRWRPDWILSAHPEDWKSRVLTNTQFSGTINLIDTILNSNNNDLNNQPILKYKGNNSNWQSIFPQPEQMNKLEIYAEAWDRIQIYPGRWYNSSIIGLGKNGPFISNYHNSDIFGDTGLLKCRVSEFVVVYQPQLMMNVSNSFVEMYGQELLNTTELQVAGFIFKKSANNPLLKAEQNVDYTTYIANYNSSAPLIVGVFIECFGTNDKPNHSSKIIQFGDQFYLRNQNGQYIVGADKSLGLNGSQYYPRLGNTGKIALEFRGGIGNVENGMIVQIKTTEEFVGKYNVLGAWTTPSCYYYSTETNYQQQNWQIFKNNPNDKLIQDGDQVYFKNIYYKDQNLVSNGLYLTTKKDVDEFWIIEKVEDQDS